LRFILKLHVKGDRETALPMLMVVLKCCGVKNSSKEGALPMLSLLQEAQCGLNLSKVPSQTLLQSQKKTSANQKILVKSLGHTELSNYEVDIGDEPITEL
jgi:hypothetical protein